MKPRVDDKAALKLAAHKLLEGSEHFILWTEGATPQPVILGCTPGASQIRALLALCHALTHGPEGGPVGLN
jgi:hypothetical protein